MIVRICGSARFFVSAAVKVDRPTARLYKRRGQVAPACSMVAFFKIPNVTHTACLLGAVERFRLFWQSFSIDDVAALQVAERKAEHVNEAGERPDSKQAERSENMNLKPKWHRFHIGRVRTERKEAAKPRADCRPVVKPVRIDV